MSEFNISAFIKTMQSGLAEEKKQEAAGRLLLNSVAQQSCVHVDVDGKMVTNLVKRNADVHEAIKTAAARQDVIATAIKYFEDEVDSKLNVHTIEDACEDLIKLLENDKSVAVSKKQSLEALCRAGEINKFLAMSFLYAVSRSNKQIAVPVDGDDIPLLAEAGYECPICHTSLVKQVKNTAIKKYRIVNIYPEDITGLEDEFNNIAAPRRIDSQGNKIVLCEKHAEEYLVEPTKEEYQKLKAIKDQMVANYSLRVDVNDMTLEDDIQTVLNGLMGDFDESELVELSMDALRIDQKIKPENHMLKNDEITRVLKYYNYINDLFSSMERDGTGDFDLIASEVNTAYKKLDNGQLTQEEVVDQLAEWIRNKSQVGSKFLRACHIVVAYFIQNCEVFREISE